MICASRVMTTVGHGRDRSVPRASLRSRQIGDPPGDLAACWRRPTTSSARRERAAGGAPPPATSCAWTCRAARATRGTRRRPAAERWIAEGLLRADRRPAFYRYEQQFTWAGAVLRAPRVHRGAAARALRRAGGAAARAHAVGAQGGSAEAAARDADPVLADLRALPRSRGRGRGGPRGRRRRAPPPSTPPPPTVSGTGCGWSPTPAPVARVAAAAAGQADHDRRRPPPLRDHGRPADELRPRAPGPRRRLHDGASWPAPRIPGLLVLPTHRLVQDLAGSTSSALCAAAGRLRRRRRERGHGGGDRGPAGARGAGRAGRPFGRCASPARRRPPGSRSSRRRPVGAGAAGAARAGRDRAARPAAGAAAGDRRRGDGEAVVPDLHPRHRGGAGAGSPRGEVQGGFFMNPTKVDQVLTACEAGFVLPQKSTYFQPKLATGLVMDPLDGPAAGAGPLSALTVGAARVATATRRRRDRLLGGRVRALSAGPRVPHQPGSGAAGRVRRAALRPLPGHRLRHGRAVVPAAGARSRGDAAWASSCSRGWRRWRRAGATTTAGPTASSSSTGDVRASGRPPARRRRSTWWRPTRRTARWRDGDLSPDEERALAHHEVALRAAPSGSTSRRGWCAPAGASPPSSRRTVPLESDGVDAGRAGSPRCACALRHPSADRPASRILVEAERGGRRAALDRAAPHRARRRRRATPPRSRRMLGESGTARARSLARSRGPTTSCPMAARSGAKRKARGCIRELTLLALAHRGSSARSRGPGKGGGAHDGPPGPVHPRRHVRLWGRSRRALAPRSPRRTGATPGARIPPGRRHPERPLRRRYGQLAGSPRRPAPSAWSARRGGSLGSFSASSMGGRSSRFGTSVISMRRFFALFSGVSFATTGDWSA